MWVMVGMTITLLGMALGAMVLINDGTIEAGWGRAFVLLSLLSFVIIDGVLIWRLVHLHKSARSNEALSQRKTPTRPS